MKECSKCKEEKELSEFYLCKTWKDGYSYNCKKCDSIHGKKYYENNREKELLRSKEYRKINKEKVNKQRAKYTSNRCKVDIQFKITINLRIRLYYAVKNRQKTGSAVSDLGCSIQHLKLHLELFWDEGMTWDNYGNKEGQWSIDHIKPLSKFDLTDRDQLLEAVNFRNLQPMWAIDNLRKFNKDAE